MSSDVIQIQGGHRIQGTLSVSGAKNAALPILISSLLTEASCTYERVPFLEDIRTTYQLLTHLGVAVKADPEKKTVSLQAHSIQDLEAPYDLVKKMRASFWVLGPLLSRFGKAKVSLPGGCSLGARPIDYHLAGLKKMGAEIDLQEGYVVASASRLKGARVVFEFPSVGATAHLMMAATLASGETCLENCAKEPEMTDLAHVLQKMGAEIQGIGTDTLLIQGKTSLQGCHHTIIGDRLEAGTFLIAALGTGGELLCEGIIPLHLEAVLSKFEELGATLKRGPDWIQLKAGSSPLQSGSITTLPFPGFPTDLQAQWMSLMTLATGSSLITETIFENRFMHISELNRLGAKITMRGRSAWVEGKTPLHGAPVMATDIRAGACLVLAGLFATGTTEISRVYHLDRGYENLEEKFRLLGAQIQRVKPHRHLT